MFALEKASDNKNIVQAMAGANEGLKEVMANSNVDDAADLMDDLADLNADVNDVTEALGQDINLGGEDEDDLMAQLEEFGEEEEAAGYGDTWLAVEQLRTPLPGQGKHLYMNLCRLYPHTNLRRQHKRKTILQPSKP